MIKHFNKQQLTEWLESSANRGRPEGNIFWTIPITPQLLASLMDVPYTPPGGGTVVMTSVSYDTRTNEVIPYIEVKDRVNQSTAQKDEGGYVRSQDAGIYGNRT
jgi:hypothetical protein